MSSELGAKAVGGGVGFFPLLFIVFLTLKLCGVIDWSWWLVCLPLYGPAVAAALLFVALAVVVVLVAVLRVLLEKK